MSDPLPASPPLEHADPAAHDAEFDAICRTLMETGRGRWFLAEHARRCRAVETDALAAALSRIEEALAEARDRQDEAANGDTPAPLALLDGLPETLGRIEARLAFLPDPAADRSDEMLDAIARLETAVAERPEPPAPTVDLEVVTAALSRIEDNLAERPEPPPALDPEAVTAALARIEAAIAEQARQPAPEPAVRPDDLAPLGRIETALSSMQATAPSPGWSDDLVAALGRIEAVLAEERAPAALTGLLEDLVAALARIEAVLMREPDEQEATAAARAALFAAIERLEANIVASLAASRDSPGTAEIRAEMVSLAGAVESVGTAVAALSTAPVRADGSDETPRLLREQNERLDRLADIWARVATPAMPQAMPAADAAPEPGPVPAPVVALEPVVAREPVVVCEPVEAPEPATEPVRAFVTETEASADFDSEPAVATTVAPVSAAPTLDDVAARLADLLELVPTPEPMAAEAGPVPIEDAGAPQSLDERDDAADAYEDEPSAAAADAGPGLDAMAARLADLLAPVSEHDTERSVAQPDTPLPAVGADPVAASPSVVAMPDDADADLFGGEPEADVMAEPAFDRNVSPEVEQPVAPEVVAEPGPGLAPGLEAVAEPVSAGGPVDDIAAEDTPVEETAAEVAIIEVAVIEDAVAEEVVVEEVAATAAPGPDIPAEEPAAVPLPTVDFEIAAPSAPPAPTEAIATPAASGTEAAEFASEPAEIAAAPGEDAPAGASQDAAAAEPAPGPADADAHRPAPERHGRVGSEPVYLPSWLVGDDVEAAAAVEEIAHPPPAGIEPAAVEPAAAFGPVLVENDPVTAYRFSIGDVPAAAGRDPGSLAALLGGPNWGLLGRIQEEEAAEQERPEPPPVHTVPIDPLAPLKSLTEEEKIALFS
jgi:hypothetical protein